MKLSAFDYTLPPDRIAQQPMSARDHSRLLHLKRDKGMAEGKTEGMTKGTVGSESLAGSAGSVMHRRFYDLPDLLQSGDVLVINDTKVLPVRLHGHKTTGGQAEILLTKRLVGVGQVETWEALTKPGLKPGQTVIVRDHTAGEVSTVKDTKFELTITCLEAQDYTRKVEVSTKADDVLQSLYHLGEMPTPPYIKEFVGDPERYQTIFATNPGSAAAPTAGLHFTPELMSTLEEKGIVIVRLTLDVGLGTFLHVTTPEISQHKMHSERFTISQSSADTINLTLKENRRVIAVGTTSLRSLEASAIEQNNYPNGWSVQAQTSETELFVYPPYRFKIASALITNFHLPKSTLLMLISAFTSAPQTNETFTTFKESWLGQAYQIAIDQEYRFFSFGDAMFIE